ncbi:MAG: hypothetical protein CSA79_05410 [Thiothrix nivea]|nr:MAG: hypothetical protein CSA79_05410 [Thiothrix nivea]
MSNFRFKLFFIVTSIFFYISPGHAKNTQKNDVGVYQLLNFQEVSYIPRIYLPDDKIIGFNRTYGFSNDSKLFSLFQIYEDDLATIRVWDIKSKALKHKKVIDNYADAGGGSYVSLEFSPSNQLISISGIVGHPFMTWKFADDNEVALSCQGYMGGYIQEASNDDQYYTVKTVDNEYSLCQPGIEGELVNYKNWMPEAWWGRNTQTLYDGKILTLYNYHLASEEPHRPKEKPPAGIMEWIDLWDLNFTSTANRLISQLDRKNKAFFSVQHLRGARASLPARFAVPG